MMKRLMANIAAFGMVGCMVLVMAGCGGSDSTKEELAQTKEDLAAAEAARMKAEADKAAAEEEAARQQAAAEEAARQQAAAEAEAEEAARQQAAAEAAAEEAARQQAAAEAEAEAEEEEAARQRAAAAAAEAARQAAARELEEARQQALNQEANQRAEKLKMAFPGAAVPADGTFPPVTASSSPVSVAAARGSLKLTRGGHAAATLSGTGIRTATMALTSGGDSGKTVVYTDRELSRPLLEHFGARRDPMDMTRLSLTAPLALPGAGTIPHPQTSTQWRITHGVPTSVAGVDITPDDTTDPLTLPEGAADAKTAASYAGTLYGKSGRFVCGGVDGCQVSVDPTYNTTIENGRFALASVEVTATAPTGTPVLYFKPSGSPSLQLYEDGPVRADNEYMVFGYWREDPTSPAANYNAGVFAQAFSEGTPKGLPTSFTATYDGTAVGMYVEQDPNNAVDTHRQGEFTADVHLTASETAVSGTIDDFVTTPTGGSAAPRTSARWVVTLGDTPAGTAASNAEIKSLPGERNGSWLPVFVQANEHAADTTPGTAGTIPPAITGTFNTRIVDFVHLLGAFGAEKR